MIGDPPILTERMRLRSYRPEDLDALAEQLGDPLTMHFYPRPYTRDEVEGWITEQRRRYERDGFGLVVMEDLQTGSWLGQCGPVAREVDGKTEIEVGWLTTRARWGEGLAPEAARACIDWLFENRYTDHVISLILPDNGPSIRVANKLGMTAWRDTIHAGLRHTVWGLKRGLPDVTGAD